MSLPASGPRKSPLDRVLGRRHVAFWSVLGSIAAVITLIVAFTGTSSPSNKPPAGRSPIPPASTPSAPQSSQAAGRATPTATAGAPSGAGGTELTHYDVTVAVGYGINFTSGSSQPINLANGSEADLEYAGGVYLEVGTSGQISELSAASPSYEECLNDTAYTTKVIVPTTGTAICFTGPGVIVAAIITAQVTQPIQSITFGVTVWKR
jgi:hypothetical protein